MLLFIHHSVKHLDLTKHQKRRASRLVQVYIMKTSLFSFVIGTDFIYNQSTPNKFQVTNFEDLTRHKEQSTLFNFLRLY